MAQLFMSEPAGPRSERLIQVLGADFLHTFSLLVAFSFSVSPGKFLLIILHIQEGASFSSKPYWAFQTESSPALCSLSTLCPPNTALTPLYCDYRLICRPPSWLDTKLWPSTQHNAWFMKANEMDEFNRKNKAESTCILLPTPSRGVRLKVLSLKLRSDDQTQTGGRPHCGYDISHQTWDSASHHHSPQPPPSLLSHSLIYDLLLSAIHFIINPSQMSLLLSPLIQHSSPNYYDLSLQQKKYHPK